MPLFQIPAVVTAEGATEADARADAEATVAAMTSVQDVATIAIAPAAPTGPFFLVFQDFATALVGPFDTEDEAKTHIAACEALGGCAESWIVCGIASPVDDLADARRVAEESSD